MNKLEIKSRMIDGIPLPMDVSNLEYCNVVSMCIKEPNDMVKVPENLQDISNVIIPVCISMDDELLWHMEEMYCYLTVKKMYVQPYSAGNRAGLHIDGFLSDQYNFIWFDSIPTCVSVGDYLLTPDHEISIKEMEQQAEENEYDSLMLDRNTLYALTQETVHEVSENYTEEPILRTFIKVTFTRDKWNAIGNAWNYRIPHIRPDKQRAGHRNHGVL